MNLVETFKKERIAINCETEQEANKFIDWCYDNGIEFKYIEKQTYFSTYIKKICYSFNRFGDGYLIFSDYEYYDQNGYAIIKYKDYFKEGIKMKTFEKYIEEISTILANSHCDNAHLCNICNVRNVCKKLGTLDEKEIQEFLLSEYKEHLKLTNDELTILRNISKEYKWIARNESSNLYVFKEKPSKSISAWIAYSINFDDLSLFNHLFQFIKFEDKEPYSIEELLKEN